jgi:hypothetical protein
LSLGEFYEYFKELFSNEDVFNSREVEDELSDNIYTNLPVNILDNEFSIDEIKQAISTLKNGKSPGYDLLIPELFKACKEIISPTLCKLFNIMLNNCLYPESWTKGIIIPVPKKGDLNDINNYRGITLTSIFSKFFSTMLDARLRKWAEQNNLLSEFQFGFRKGRSTVDCIFTLSSIIKHVITNENKKLYCAFVDFRKAFDLVYRDGIWLKLIRYGCSSKMVQLLKKIYESVKSCVRLNNEKSEFFDSFAGVKQGEPLSPFLFIFFINDMYNSLCDDRVEMFTMNEVKIFMLLFADDTVLFSYTKQGLQILLDKLHDYCNKWGISVNINKTVIMVCKRGNQLENVEIMYGGEKLEVVNKFIYLGVCLSSNGSFYQTQLSLSKQALKAMYSLNSLFEKVPMHITDKIKLFDSMVKPILMYGSEIWGFHKSPDVERVYLKFLKYLLCVRQQTTSSAVYGELGLFPQYVSRKIQIIKYWYKLKSNPDSLMSVLCFMKSDNGNLVNDWAIKVKELLDNLGFSSFWDNNITSLQLKSISKESMTNMYKNGFLN